MSSLPQDRGNSEPPVATLHPGRELPEGGGHEAGVLENAQRALLNILEDFASEKLQLAGTERAVLNILDDFSEEKVRLEMTQRAVLNILEDLDAERVKVEAINQRLQSEVEVRKRAEDGVRRYAEDLKHSNQELEYFAYVASHDLQEPLRTVSSFSQLLARRYQGQLDADANDFITFVVEGATRMQTLINDLLAFSRVGTRGNPFSPVAAEKVLQSAKESLEAAIAESGAMITHDPLPTLIADETQLRQLFQNLLSNAIKFRRPEQASRIHVSATRQDGAWQLSVRDNGIGIAPQYFERIFVLFQRLHGRDEYPGTGIGLAICKKIVERHGGRIWVESDPSRGSTFYFTIPDERRSHDEPSPAR